MDSWSRLLVRRELPLVARLRGIPRWKVALALLTLLAAAIRFWQLSFHSLWFDETMSVFWATRPAGEIIDVGLHLAQDKHPPVYYLLLHYWTALFGTAPVAVRSLSALFGALLVPAVAWLGRDLLGERAGLAAGILVAVNPMLVWYSQEARMFGPATTLAVLATLCLVQALTHGGWRWWAGYVLLSLLALYSYLFVAFLFPFQGMLALGWVLLAGQTGREDETGSGKLPQILASFSVLALLAAPLAWTAIRVGGAEAAAGRPFANLLPTLWHLLRAYTIRGAPWPGPAIMVIGALALALLLLGIATAPPRGRLALSLWLAVPLLAGNFMLALDATVFAETRYFLFLMPALCLAWGSGLAWVGARRPGLYPLLAGAWVGVAILALPSLWSPENRREDWQGAAAYVASHAGPHDAVLIHPAFVHVAFEYYYEGSLPIFYPFEGAVEDPAQVDAPLQGLIGYSTLWLVTSHDAEPDPQHLVQGWLDARFPLVTEQYPTGVVVRGYAVRYRLAGLPAHGTRMDVRYADGLRLAGHAVDQDRLAATDDRYHPPSNWIHVTLYWTADQTLDRDLSVGLKLVDGMGQVWGDRLYRAGEALERYPSSQWKTGEIIRQDVDVNLNPVTPPGSYRLELTALDGEDEPWPVDGPSSQTHTLGLADITIVE